MSLPSILVLVVVLAMFVSFMAALGYASAVGAVKAEPPAKA